jgi:hypothetical protein
MPKNATITITREQNALIRRQLESHANTLKNHIASAVEDDDFQRAKRLTGDLREVQALWHVIVPDDCWERKHGA